MQKLMLDQKDSIFFKLPVEIREHIYAIDKAVIAKIEQTCQRVHAEVDVFVDAKSMAKDMSAWSQVRKCSYGSVNLLPLKNPQTAKALCRNAFALHKARKEVLDVLEAIPKSQGDIDKQLFLMRDLRNKQQHRRLLLAAEEKELDLITLLPQQG